MRSKEDCGSRMKILVAPDKFKGSLDALVAAQAIERGLQKVWPRAEISRMPIADGGEGTAEAICAAMHGEWVDLKVRDAVGEHVDARYAWIGPATAVIEMSAASGLWRVPPEKRNPLRASTFGTGEMIAHAIRHGVRKILIGIGGSATNDGGIGMAAALGYEFLTSGGELLEPVPANLLVLARIKPPEGIQWPEIVALCDVQNPLLGERGASRTYGPQKGADPAMVETLERSLDHLADLISQYLGCDFREVPGSGAAGGLAFGLMSFCGAIVRPGFEAVAEILQLERAIEASDLIITGEGSIDAQTFDGKGPAGVAALARKHGKPVIAFAGAIAPDPRLAIFDAVCPISERPLPLAESLRDAAALLEQSAERVARMIVAGKFLSGVAYSPH